MKSSRSRKWRGGSNPPIGVVLTTYCAIKATSFRNRAERYISAYASVAELADALDLGSSKETCEGSNPSRCSFGD